MLTPADETDLLTALFRGPLEQPYWSTFLERLQRRTRAERALLIIAHPGESIHSARQWFAGPDLSDKVSQLTDLADVDPTPYHRLRPGRVYAAMELIDPQIADHRRFRYDYLEKLGVGHGRYMRVVEPGGINCWLSIARAKEEFSAADSSIMSSLAPHLSVALQMLVALEADRFRLSLARTALERAGIGCAIEEGANAGTHIVAGRSEGESDKLICPLPDNDYVTPVQDGVLALKRRARPTGAMQVEAMMERFGLTRSEARLALHLAEGHSLQEAGEMLNLTRETARNYSKRVYDKTNSRGQADLVRRILTHVVMLA